MMNESSVLTACMTFSEPRLGQIGSIQPLQPLGESSIVFVAGYILWPNCLS